MTPQIARLYTHLLPVFRPYLWLQRRWIFKRQDTELRTVLIDVTRWGHVHIVRVGDSWRACRKPAAIRANWDDPVWESHIAPNMAAVFQTESETLLAPNPSAPNADVFPCSIRGRCPAGAEGGEARADTSWQTPKVPTHPFTGRAPRGFRSKLLPQTKTPPSPEGFSSFRRRKKLKPDA